jgi:hypothetical protein
MIYAFDVIGGCQLQPSNGCQIALQPGEFIGGLAYDRVTQSLFYATATFAPWTPGSTMVYVAPASSPCQPFCSYSLRSCQYCMVSPVVGLAFDPCDRVLIATDGLLEPILSWTHPCTFGSCMCCGSAGLEWYGIALKRSACAPVFHTSGICSHAHHPCAGHGCPMCRPLPGHDGGPPQVGNPSFALTLSDGPNPGGYGAAAWLLLSGANACRPQALPMPCGLQLTLYPDRFLGIASFVVPMVVSGQPPCGLSATAPLPIPAMPGLCGTALCGQWAVVNARPSGSGSDWCITLSEQFSLEVGG